MDLKNKISKKPSGVTIPQLVSELLQSAVYIHFLHLRTKSYAEHKALGSYYEDIPDLADGIAEQYQGQFGLQTYPEPKLSKPTDAASYLTSLVEMVDKAREGAPSHIQNQLDEVKSLIYSTLYKLNNLS